MGYLLSLQPTFTQGLVIGQLSIFFLLALVLKYLFLVSDPSTSHHLPTATAIISRSPPKQAAPREPSGESTEWLNVIISEIVETFRAELRDNQAGPEGDESTRVKIETQLNAMRPEGFDPILVHSVNLGSSAPILSNAQSRSTHNPPNSQDVGFDMTYRDTASISFSTSVLFNYPFPYFARLPVSLTLSLSVFSSKIILTPPRPSSSTPELKIALDPSFTLDLHISSLLGSRAKLADVPKLHDMIESQIKKFWHPAVLGRFYYLALLVCRAVQMSITPGMTLGSNSLMKI
ncbi:hypothetical protein JB92DRAFT_1049938 [Gautieria morchelliformis]|nr:hypothetical protein JB92DRAFT_1049938 [Gautieria morchelliformis]